MTNKIDVIQEFMERIQSDGIAFSTVSDGYVMGFTAATLRELLEKAEASETGMITAFVQRPSIHQS